MGIFGPPPDKHEEESHSSWNVFGSTYSHTITEDDGTNYTGHGWSAEDASKDAHDQHDRDGR